MIRRLFLLASLVFVAAAACDPKFLDFVSDMTSNSGPSAYEPKGGNITCCRCAASGCKASSSACPPGYEPSEIIVPMPPKQQN
jgi:hypothetical protein